MRHPPTLTLTERLWRRDITAENVKYVTAYERCELGEFTMAWILIIIAFSTFKCYKSLTISNVDRLRSILLFLSF